MSVLDKEPSLRARVPTKANRGMIYRQLSFAKLIFVSVLTLLSRACNTKCHRLQKNLKMYGDFILHSFIMNI